MKRLKINPSTHSEIIVLTSLINMKLAELDLLNRRLKSERTLLKEGKVLWANALYLLILEKQRLEAQIESMIESLSNLEKSSDDGTIKELFNRLWVTATGNQTPKTYIKEEWWLLKQLLSTKGIEV